MAADSSDSRGVPPEREPGTHLPNQTLKENLDWKADDEDEWAEAKRQIERAKREGGAFYTTQQVFEHLKSLEGK